MSHSVIYEGSKAQLIKQLVYFDEEKANFLNQYFPDFGPRRSAAERLIHEYVTAVEQLSAHFTPDLLHSIVLIGSELEICYLDDHFNDTFTIVFPHLADPDHNRVSILSPLGYQLLLAKIGETRSLDVPSGQTDVRIEQIKFVNNGETPV